MRLKIAWRRRLAAPLVLLGIVASVGLGAWAGALPAQANDPEGSQCATRRWNHNGRHLESSICKNGSLATLTAGIEERTSARVSYMDVKLRAWQVIDTDYPCMPPNGYSRVRNVSRAVRYNAYRVGMSASYRLSPGCSDRIHTGSYAIARTRARHRSAQREEVYTSLDNRFNENCQADKCWWNAGTSGGKPGQPPVQMCSKTCRIEFCCQ
jgi:hypothetical protein